LPDQPGPFVTWTAWPLRNFESQAAPLRGVVGRAASTPLFDLDRWAPSESAGRFVEHFWSVSWDLRGRDPLANTVITFPSLHITHEWGSDTPRHGSRWRTRSCTVWSTGYFAPRSASAAPSSALGSDPVVSPPVSVATPPR
jgi:hypothetical protein